MKIIVISRSCGKSRSAEIGLTIGAAILFFILITGMLAASYTAGKRNLLETNESSADAIQSIFENERKHLNEARSHTQEHLDALALRLGRMQAHVLRLDALGERLVQVGNLDGDEFNFAKEPPLGGDLDKRLSARPQAIKELIADMERLTAEIDGWERKLNVLEDLLLNHNLQKEVYPTGRPIKSGWISSHYGRRTDPFTGKRVMHKGIDFAGKKGSDVIAVAAGIVAKVSRRKGYGRLVEINHGNGYRTRYGHNEAILVNVGERVSQGQTIAKMGSSGRSTGPHVHFEVVLNGKHINPAKYVRTTLAQ